MVNNLVGTRIRAIRAQRKMTQQTLADLAGVPRATLATAERDDANPSLAVVFKIATALGAPIDDLVEQSRERIQRIDAARMRRISSGDGVYHATTISPPNAQHFTQQIFNLEPGRYYEGRPHSPGSEEFLHIMGGEVVLEVVSETVVLQAGDSARFRGNVAHTYRNPGTVPARGLVTILEGFANPAED